MKRLISAAAVLTAVLGLAACGPTSTPAGNTAPVASFTFTPASGPAALTVTTANTSTDAQARADLNPVNGS